MCRARVAEVGWVAAIAVVATAILALPVLLAPSERVFGTEIVGRHRDPFTVMQQLRGPIQITAYSQPVTDIPGVVLARMSGGVAAYNWLVLLSFPLSAVAAFLLARHIGISAAASAVVAMFYAFSPFHIAHAAYHPHIAQTQWVPLYLLALWRCLNDASTAAVVLLGVAAAGVALSNFYGGLIMAIVSPVAVGAYWLCANARQPRAARHLRITIGTLVLLAFSGIVYALTVAPAVFADRSTFAFPRIDLMHYSARWWSYLTPPVQHPLLGATARRVWSGAGITDGLLEQQITIGWGIITLGVVALYQWRRRIGTRVSMRYAPVLLLVGAAAFVCSLAPDWISALYAIAPMFRAYARFAVVVQLMAVLLAGLAVDYIWRTGGRSSKVACAALLLLAGFEYMVAPTRLWRDVLPTSAHRWLMQQPGRVRALDCIALTRNSQSIEWLTGDRVTLLSRATGGCTEPHFPRKLVVLGYTHLLIRRDTPEADWFANSAARDGLRPAATFEAADVFDVTGAMPDIYTATMTGFFVREHKAKRTWRWMGESAAWTIVNTTSHPIVATLDIELWSFHHARRLDVLLGQQPVRTLLVEPRRRVVRFAQLTVNPGGHELVFRPAEAPTIAADVIKTSDRRALSFAIGAWNWSEEGEGR